MPMTWPLLNHQTKLRQLRLIKLAQAEWASLASDL